MWQRCWPKSWLPDVDLLVRSVDLDCLLRCGNDLSNTGDIHVLRSLKVLLFNHVAYIVKNLISDLKSFLYQEHGTWFSSRLCFVSRISSEQASLTWQPFLWWNPTTTMCSTGTRFSSLPWGSMFAGPCGLWALDSEIPGRTESSCSVSKQNRGAGSKQSAVNPARSVHVLKEQRKTQEKTRNQCLALPVTTALRWRSFRFAINNSFELWRLLKCIRSIFRSLWLKWTVNKQTKRLQQIQNNYKPYIYIYI